jgi:hypothetical protein
MGLLGVGNTAKGCSIISYTPPPRMKIDKAIRKTVMSVVDGVNTESRGKRMLRSFFEIFDK